MTLQRLFKENTRYLVLALALSWMAFTFAVMLQNRHLLLLVISDASAWESVLFFLSLYGSIHSNFTIVSATSIVMISLLFGVNVAIITYLVRRRVALYKHSAVGTVGAVLGAFGIGCAACGSILLTGLLATVGGASLLTLLPFGGEEFSFLGVVVLGYTTYTLTKRLKDPNICHVRGLEMSNKSH